MSDNKPLKLNIRLKYKYFDKKLQKYVYYNYKVLEYGSFDHKKIRNQNFYDNIIDTKTNCVKNSLCSPLVDAIDTEISNNPIELAIPFSNKYISLDSLDKIIIDKTTNNDVPKELDFQELILELNKSAFNTQKYEIKTIDGLKYFFIDIINNLFNTGSSNIRKNNRTKLLHFISNYDEKDILYFYKVILYNIKHISTALVNNIPSGDIDYLTEIKDMNDFNFNEISMILTKLASIIDSKNESLINCNFYKYFMSIIKKNQDNNKKNIFENFKNKKFMNLFNNKFDKKGGEQIKKLFNTLDEDYNKVVTFNKESSSSGFYIPVNEQRYLKDIRPKKYNTKEKLESIIYDYLQYIDKDIYNKFKKNKQKLIEHVLQRDTLLKQIITYYNIFKLLSEIYLIQDTIIFDDTNTIKGSSYKKLLNIKPMLQREQDLKPIITDNTIDFIYRVIFEEIPETSLLIFNINIKYYDEKLDSYDEDSYDEKYIPYSTSIYSQKNNLSDYIIYNHQLDIKKIISQFPFLIQNDDLFKKVKPNNVKEIFLNNQLFEHINKPKFIDSSKDKDIQHGQATEHYIRDNYINEVFFKKNNILFLNKKFYQITEAKINENITIQRARMNKHNIINIDKDKNKSLGNYLAFKNIDKRLAYSNVATSLNFYLDVYCYVKNKIDEKISFNKKFESFFNCNNNANNLDILFKDLLQEYYSENTFKKLLKNNKNTDEAPPIDKAPLLEEVPDINQKQINNTKPNDDLKKFDDKIDFDDKMYFERKTNYGGKKLIKKKEKKLIIKKNKKNKKNTIFSKMYYNNNNNNNKKLKKYTSKYHKNKRKVNLKTKTIKLIKYYLNF